MARTGFPSLALAVLAVFLLVVGLVLLRMAAVKRHAPVGEQA